VLLWITRKSHWDGYKLTLFQKCQKHTINLMEIHTNNLASACKLSTFMRTSMTSMVVLNNELLKVVFCQDYKHNHLMVFPVLNNGYFQITSSHWTDWPQSVDNTTNMWLLTNPKLNDHAMSQKMSRITLVWTSKGNFLGEVGQGKLILTI